ncbi:MAG: DNA methyltransferase [Candidatus Heimdallarchaeota archaeon]
MLVPINQIALEKEDGITKRVRTKFGDIQKLADSIKTNGLLHPVVVDTLEEEDEGYAEGKRYRLIAGERRIRAHIMNGMGEIEITIQSELTKVDRKIMELEENTVRQDLTWQEQAEALRQLDEMKRKKFGSKSGGRLAQDSEKEKTGWTQKDTAECVNQSQTKVSRDIKLAETLRNRPDLAKKVKKLPKHAAEKVIKATLEEELLARRVAAQHLKLDHSILFGPAEVLIKTIPDESIDCWCTDPPFGLEGIAELGNDYNLTKSNVSNFETMDKVYQQLIPEVFRTMKPGAHFYVFFAHGWYIKLYNYLKDAGFHVDASPLIWAKGKPTVVARDMHYQSSYEAIFYGWKPPRNRILRKPVLNVFQIPPIHASKRIHPLQRPDKLLRILIENSTQIGETVLDTFAGSGSTIVMAKKLQRSGIAFELDRGNFLRAQQWLGIKNEEFEKEKECSGEKD